MPPFSSLQNPQMLEFECHYRVDKWETGKYFNFVEEVCNTADRERPEEECDPPPCPTTPIPTEESSSGTVGLILLVFRGKKCDLDVNLSKNQSTNILQEKLSEVFKVMCDELQHVGLGLETV